MSLRGCGLAEWVQGGVAMLSGFKGVWPQYWAVNTMECELELEFIVPASLIPRLP